MNKKALIVWGGWDGHEPDLIAKIYQEILEENGFETEISNTLDSFVDYEKLKDLSLIVPIWTMGEIEPSYVTNVARAVENGVGIAGHHGGMCDSFRNNTDWQFLTGSQWVAHPGNVLEYKVNFKKSSCSEIIKDLDDFIITSEQYYIHVDPAVNVLATTRFPVFDGPHAANGEVDVPVAYTKKWGKGNVFYCTLGHVAKDFEVKEVSTLMENGFNWAAKRLED